MTDICTKGIQKYELFYWGKVNYWKIYASGTYVQLEIFINFCEECKDEPWL